MAAGERLKLLMESQKGKPNGVAGLNESGKVPSGQLPAMDYVPTSRKVNGKALTADITLSAADTGAIPVAEKGATGGVATLDDSGKVPREQLPAMNYDPAGSAEAVQDNLNAHTNNKSNPHGVTAQQVGADPAGSAEAVQGNLNTHTNNKNNPHGVTAAQTGALPLSGGTMNGDINLGGHKIIAEEGEPFLDNGDDRDPFQIRFASPGGEPTLLLGGTSINDAFLSISRTGSSYGISAGSGYSPQGIYHLTTKGYVDDKFSQLPDPLNLKYGTYVGTGTYGSSSPKSLTFEFSPRFVIVTGPYSGSQVAWPLLFIRGNTSAFELGEGAYTCKATWSGKTLNWYSDINAGRQMNYDGRTYYYVAFG